MKKAKKENNLNENKTEKAYFASGCFWHPQDVFSKLKGVVSTSVGYMGGNERDYPNPSYEQVCNDETGFVETVMIEFNPEKISYNKLLKKFWEIHDPTQLDRQGPDVGSQYRSVIFHTSNEQRKEAIESKKKIQEKSDKRVVTYVIPAKKFFKAEEYHQDYVKKGGACNI